MSGDVQPRKRKDKKRKKDELSVEEPRGTAAALGEGDVFIHSYQDHGTGGHWCAKVIFFSLLAVLVTLIGLIILENRGLSELEANSVESRYSGMLEGWLEDAPDGDHHDEHTLELTHHDDDEDEHDAHDGHQDEDDISHEDDSFGDDHDDDDHDDDDDDHDDDGDEHDDEDEEDNSQADDEEDDNSQAADEDEDDRGSYRKYYRDDDDGGDEQDEEDNEQDEEDDERIQRNSYDQNNDDDDDDSEEDENGDERVKHSLFDQVDDVDDNEEAESERSNFYNRYENVDDADDEDDHANDDDHDHERVSRSPYDHDDDENNLSENDNEDETDYLSHERDEQLSEEDENIFEKNNDENEDDDEHDEQDNEDDEHDDEIEVEKIEKEPDDEEPISLELPALPEADDDNEQDDENDDENSQDEDKSDEFLDPEDDELPVVERITVPAGKPFVEVEDTDVSTELPPDTLEEEEEYEKKQEELRKTEEEESTNMWLKLSIGAALLAATHAVMRRATTTRDDDAEDDISREETPITDRRMTLIPEEVETVTPKKVQGITKPVIENVVKKIAPPVKVPPKPQIEEDEEIEEIEMEEENEDVAEKDKELYSDDEEVMEEEDAIIEQKGKPKTVLKEPTPESEEDADDVEIIDEQVEEEIIEEEEEISDVDDTELLTRLEAKYGRLPEPERPTPTHKDGGNNVDDDWPGEPAHAYWQQQLDEAEKELRQGSWSAAAVRAQKEALKDSARARWLLARALDEGAERQRDNALLSRAIAAYMNLLKMHESLSDNKLKQIADRTVNRMMFRGNYINTEPVYRLMIRRFPQDPSYRNNLSIAFLMANKNDMAEEVLKETLKLWPDDSVALAHYAFVLKNQHNRLEEAVDLFQKALKGDKGPACEPRFYYNLGDALLLLGRFAEAHEVHKRAAKLGHFLSPAQRSLYNVKRLKGQPWWNVEQTPYAKLARALEKSWKDILKEGLAAHASYEKEKEGLKERGEWSQLDLFARGYEIPDRCKKAPITCSIVKTEPAAVGCRRGQIKFSAMEAGTHVRPHVGPTNCRLRMHLALSNTKDTHLRVDQETRQWQEGKVLMFDDSFEHEVWHNGTGKRLVLIVDVWHPDLTPVERRQLSPI